MKNVDKFVGKRRNTNNVGPWITLDNVEIPIIDGFGGSFQCVMEGGPGFMILNLWR